VKAIGQAARLDLQTLLDKTVHLFLFVKVREHWGDDPERFRMMGLDFPR
jgi:GTP-binding protein Era